MNRVVVITGASRGLGLSLAQRFLASGDKVFGVSKTKRHWKKALREIENSKKLSLHQADLTSEAQVKRFINKVKAKAKRIDLVINNAGYGGVLTRIEDLSLRETRKFLDLNFISAFLVSKAVIPIMRRQKKGMIINVSSMAGQRAVPRLSAYSASKFAMLALSQAIAKENDDKKIKAVTICPGGMNTEMRAVLFGKKDAARQQTTDFVAEVTRKVIEGKIKVESGGDIVIRHGKITAINPCPAP